MIDGFKLFDAYGLRAQLFPALISGLPTLGLFLVVVPWDHLGTPHAIAALMSAVLMYAFADLARRHGRKVEARLGTRTTPQLFYRGDPAVDEPLKVRYRDFLAKQINAPIPTEQDEQHDPQKANAFYNSAGTWLREHTRDTKKFKLLFNELIAYGFRRNLLGLKYLSVALNMLVLAASAFILWFRPAYFAAISDIDGKVWTVIGASILHSLFMIVGVNKKAVIEASHAYGRQLVLCTEAFLPKPKAPSKPRKPKATPANPGQS